MNDNRIPLYQPSEFFLVPEAIYGDLVAAAVRVAVSHEQAEQLVDAILGPLKLLPPIPDRPANIVCDSVYFSREGEYHFCVKQHNEPDDDPAFHRTRGQDWDDEDNEDNDPRIFHRDQFTG